jgi:FkbM family methyltransferase
MSFYRQSVSFFRKRHYRYFRRVVENRLFYWIFSRLTLKWSEAIEIYSGYTLYLNPVFHGQFREPADVEEYEQDVKHALALLVDKGVCVYDVGANIGILTLFAAKLTGDAGRVYAFEPEDVNLACLRKTRERNRLANVEVLETCVTSLSDTVVFDRRGGAFSGRAVYQGTPPISRNLCQKPSVSLDDFVFLHGNRPPNVVKIDVEGNEAAVLQGMAGILQKYKPSLICELHSHLGDNLTPVYSLLTESGYSLFRLSEWLQGGQQELQSLRGTSHIVALKKVDAVCQGPAETAGKQRQSSRPLKEDAG